MSMTHVEGRYHFAVVGWSDDDGITTALCDELTAMGHLAVQVRHDADIPHQAEMVFSFGPYGKFLPIARRLANLPSARRPLLIHWNTEGMPDLRMPWSIMSLASAVRSWIGRRFTDVERQFPSAANSLLPLELEQTRMLRFRYVGDYYYAFRKGWLPIYADSSAIYSGLHHQHGLPTIYFPWGAMRSWYTDLELARDIDVLWMGKHGSPRRRRILEQVRSELRSRGINIYMADNEERPFVFGNERTILLNRAKITLNVMRTWYDDNFSRLSMAAPNRSLVISEPILPHCPEFVSGQHYVAASVDKLCDAIVHYLTHEAERTRIVENAYRLMTTELTMSNSIRRVLCVAEQMLCQRRSVSAHAPHPSPPRRPFGTGISGHPPQVGSYEYHLPPAHDAPGDGTPPSPLARVRRDTE